MFTQLILSTAILGGLFYPSRIVIPSTPFDKGVIPQSSPTDVTTDFLYVNLDIDRNVFLTHYEYGGYAIQGVQAGDEVLLYYNQKPVRYVVTKVSKYQALSPSDPYSNFRDIGTGEIYTSTQLAAKVFGEWYTIQTCLLTDGNTQWGRLFIQIEKQDRPPHQRR